MPSTPWTCLAIARAGRVARILAIAPILVVPFFLAPFFLAGALVAATAQTASQDRSNPPGSMAITVGDTQVSYIFRIDQITASPGVPRHDVVCAPRPPGQRPGVLCDIRFDAPTKLAGYTIGESENPGSCARPRDCWTASLVQVAATGAEVPDDSAFLFMLDRGGTDANQVQREDRDLVAILAGAGPKQQIAVATYSRSLNIVSKFDANRTSMSADLRRIRPDGGTTELYRSAIDGVNALADRKARRKFLVILSDGTANDTAFDPNALIKAAKDHNVQVIAIGYAPNRNDTSQLQNLRKIATDTNGTYIEVRGTRQATALDPRTFLNRFSSGYLLTADSPSGSLPRRVYATLRFDQNGTSVITIDTATTPTQVGPLPGAGERPAQPTRSLLDRITDNWPIVAGVAAVLVVIAAFALLRSRRARPPEPVAPPALAGLQDHHAPPPPLPPAAAITPPAAPPPTAPPPTVAPQPSAPAPEPVRPIVRPIYHDREGDGAATVVQNGSNGSGPTVVAPPSGDTAKPLAFVEIDEQGRQRRYPISKNLARIGRSTENDIVLAADHVSREHAEIISNGFGGWEIKNRTWRRPAAEGGVNPIEVNGHQIDAETHPLHDGDVVRLGNIGNTHLTFRQNAQRSR